jgi:hypothetical protein
MLRPGNVETREEGGLDLVWTAFLGIAMVSLAGVLAAAGAMIVQYLVPVQMRKSHNVAIGIIYGGLYVLFGVMVGFTAFLVLDKYNTAQAAVQSEAGEVEELHNLAERFPEPERSRVQEAVTAYAHAVVDIEWPLMGEGRASPRVEELSDGLRATLQEYEPKSGPEQALYAQAIDVVGDLEANRDVRLLYAREGLPPILWVALAGLSIIMMFFSFLVGMENNHLHRAMVAALAAGLVLVLFTIGIIDHPFGTAFRVGTDPFELVLHEIQEGDE